ncbi:MAG: AAA family ATPase [Candidatus Thiosymbion ectosymbiont of Robbea hypermnestra]|nr:AAA family ATPase [Candidatus Thiosymbion ectosymbiont of Robbea hypermnestra]
MYLRRIVLENIRGFSKLDFSFQKSTGGSSEEYAGWDVITGDNASGKTAFLKAMSLALIGPDTARALQPSLDGWIRQEEPSATIAVQIVAGDKDKFAQGPRYDQPFWSELELRSEADGNIRMLEGNKYRKKGKGPTRGPWTEHPDGWFCTGYGPFRRLYGHSPEAQRLMSASGRVARFATLFREDATLQESDLWLKELNYKGLEGDGESHDKLQLVLRILAYEFLQNGMTVERVDSNGLWLKDARDITLSLRDLSDGYRSAIAMLTDILRQLVDVYGGIDLMSHEDRGLVINNTGVVLIDEVDSHLHPTWQREIGFWFQRVFPKVQFIVTTHSPLICQAASPDSIWHLPAPGSSDPPFRLDSKDYTRVVAGKPDAILLTPAFGLGYTRSPRAVAARREYAELKAKSRTVSLTSDESERQGELQLFVDADDDRE